MGLNESEFYHGSVFSRIARCGKPVSITKLDDKSQGFYLLDGNLPILIKHSSKKLSPWRFSFFKKHQDDLQELKNEYKKALIIFVCHHDGHCCLDFDEFKSVLDYVHEETEWVSISRSKNKQYSVSGKDGQFKGKIASRDLEKKIINSLNQMNGVR